jgi:hypothetical protein
MIQKELYRDDIFRSIETVVKADDQEHIQQEVLEYVMTNEISKKIRDLFSHYVDYQNVNGVWISGFFGSGKSHLLKILSYVLENRQYNGYALAELFAEKIETDDMLKADVLQSTRIHSESVLFNIDQQAQITSKKEDDAILNVFYKVFNDHLGYFGTQRHIADFERWLDQEGVYHRFRDMFEEKYGDPWLIARRKYFDPKVKDTLAEVLGQIHKKPASDYAGILDTLRKDVITSVDDFCEKVKQYIQSKPKGFRLNFFVDEVGQYISDNSKLMLNLQTIAETLATRTQGRSWIFVTSQEDMESVIGDLNRKQQNDFSRIQARFRLKIPLTSANVDEVIERRLLWKKNDCTPALTQVFQREKANLETLLSFTELGIQFKGYQGETDYVRKFPFVPYQFDLFQQSIRALSKHNAFQGKHASVGERSMLGVFQEVAQLLADKDERTLVSYDLLFEGLRSTIRGEIQNAVTLAERQLEDPLALRILKALFLVKYYTAFKTTSRNISTLMITRMDVNLPEHEKKVTEALNLLENQTYIQRNGDVFEFLTDEEKDIEEEIKATELDETEVTSLVKEIVFDTIIRDSKIRFTDNKQDYEYTMKVDESLFGREKELITSIITSNFRNYGREDYYKAQTMGFNTIMMMVLPPDPRLMTDLRMYLKTDKYIKRSQTMGSNESHKRILYDKGQQNLERKRLMVMQFNRLLGESSVYMNGTLHSVTNSSDGRTKVINAFQDLVRLAYPNLKMLGNTVFTEDTIRNVMHQHGDILLGGSELNLSEAESEILNLVNRRKKQSERTSLAELRDYFARKPYGWYPNAVWTLTAMLYKKGKIEAVQDSDELDANGLMNAFFNNRWYANTLIQPQVVSDSGPMKKLYQELFDEPCPAHEARDVVKVFRDKLRNEADALTNLLAGKSSYPFLASLESARERLLKYSEKDNAWLVGHLSEYEESLLDDREDLINPVKRFWNGDQKQIFDQVKMFMDGNQSNLEFVEGDELTTISEAYHHPRPYSGDVMRKAKAAMNTLQTKVLEKIAEEKTAALEKADEVRRNLIHHYEFQNLKPVQQEKLLQPLVEEIRRLENQRYIANIRQAKYTIGSELQTRILNEMVRLSTPEEKEDPEKAEEQKVHYIRKESVRISFTKRELKTEADVAEYVEAMKTALLEQIRQNKRIAL